MTKNEVKTKKQGVSRSAWINLGASLLLLVLGIVVIIWRSLSINTLCVVTGASAVVFGIILIIVYFLSEIQEVGQTHDLSIGSLCVILGVILLIRPADVVDLLQVLVGIFLMIDSVFKLQAAVDAKRLGISGWWTILIVTVACLALGVIMVLRIASDMIMLLIGLSLLIDGVQNLIMVVFSMIAQRRRLRHAQEAEGAAKAAAAEKQAGEPEKKPAEPEPQTHEPQKAPELPAYPNTEQAVPPAEVGIASAEASNMAEAETLDTSVNEN